MGRPTTVDVSQEDKPRKGGVQSPNTSVSFSPNLEASHSSKSKLQGAHARSASSLGDHGQVAGGDASGEYEVRPQTSLWFSPSEWLLSPLRPSSSMSSVTRILRSSAGRWTGGKKDTSLELFPPGQGREEFMQLKSLFAEDPVLPRVRSLQERPATTDLRRMPLKSNLTMSSNSNHSTGGGGNKEDDEGGSVEGDVSLFSAQISAERVQKKQRGGLLAANNDVLTVASGETMGSEAVSMLQRPATSVEDYRSISGLTRQANRRSQRILDGPEGRPSEPGAKKSDKSEWVPAGFQPRAVMEREWVDTCGMWEASRQKYEIMISKVDPEKELQKLATLEKEKAAKKAELELENEKKQEEGAVSTPGKHKGMFWLPGEGYVSKDPRKSTGEAPKTTPMGMGSIKRQYAARIEEIRWSVDKQRELAEKVEEHWKVKKLMSGAATYSFVKENSREQKARTLQRKINEIDEQRIKHDMRTAQTLEREKQLREEKLQQCLELEKQVVERMAKLDQRGAPSPPRERMGRSGWHPVGVLPCLMGRSPMGMPN